MIESAGKHSKIYVEYTKGKYKPTCIIHGPGHSLYECKVLGDFCSKYDKIRPTDDPGYGLTKIRKFNRQHYKNDVVNSAVNEILMHEYQRVSADKGAHENIYLVLMIVNYTRSTI